MGWFNEAEDAELERKYGPAVPKPVPQEAAQQPRQLVKGREVDAMLFMEACRLHGLPTPIPEFAFSAARRWRFDWVWIGQEVALEIEGGVWTKGRHTRGKGFLKDMEKYNEATLAGWKLLRCTPADVKDGSVFELLKRALNG